MKIVNAIIVSFFLVVGFAATASAQGPLGGTLGPLPRGMFNPVVGSGAEYEYQPNGKDKVTVGTGSCP